MRTLIFLMALGLLIAGCSNPGGGNATGNATAGAPGMGTQAASEKCKETIPYQTLISALPGKTGRFTAQSPEGTTLVWTDPANPGNTVKYSTASEVLTSTNASVIVSVLDTCYVQYLSAGWPSRTAFNSTQGFMQLTTVASYPAWEQYDHESDTYSMNVLVKDRVLVTVQGTEGATEADVRAVAEALSYNTLANAATT